MYIFKYNLVSVQANVLDAILIKLKEAEPI